MIRIEIAIDKSHRKGYISVYFIRNESQTIPFPVKEERAIWIDFPPVRAEDQKKSDAGRVPFHAGMSRGHRGFPEEAQFSARDRS